MSKTKTKLFKFHAWKKTCRKPCWKWNLYLMQNIYLNQTQYRHYIKGNLRLIAHVELNNASCSNPRLQKRCKRNCSREPERERSLNMDRVVVYGLSLVWIWGSTAPQKPGAREPIACTNTPSVFRFLSTRTNVQINLPQCAQETRLNYYIFSTFTLFTSETFHRQTSAGNSNFM